MEKRFEEANQELSILYQRLMELSDKNHDEIREEFQFYLGLIERLLLSAVIEGDRRDTAAFMNEIDQVAEPKDWPSFWKTRLRHVENKLSAFPQETPLQQARSKISEQCCRFATKAPGIFRFNVPT